MDLDEIFGVKRGDQTPGHRGGLQRPDPGSARKRTRFDDADNNGYPVSKKPMSHLNDSMDTSEKAADELGDDEKLKILKMIEEEPEVPQMDETALRRMVSVLEKRITKNREMRIKYPDQPEKFMESEVELNESIQELHSLPINPDLYPMAVELRVTAILLNLLPHENTDISCAVLNLFQEVTDVDTINENEDATAVFITDMLEQQSIPLLTQNLDRLDESNKDEADGVHNTLAIFENLFEVRPELCDKAGESGLLQWLLKRIRSRLPFDGNKLYAAETLAILLQDSANNREKLGELDGIDILLQQLAFYKRHDPGSNEEAEYMENLFNCLCSALLWGANREKFLKGEGPHLMNLMLKERKQSRSGSLKVLNHAVSGPDGAANANKVVEILGLRSIFPLFMKTPKKTKRKGLTALEFEEHVVSIIAGIFQHVATGQMKNRLMLKFEENNLEKVERLVELHFKYAEKVEEVDRVIQDDLNADNEGLDEDEVYLRRLDSGLFTLQLIDYILLEVCVASANAREKVKKLFQLRKGSFVAVTKTVKVYGDNLGDENQEWKTKQKEHIESLTAELLEQTNSE